MSPFKSKNQMKAAFSGALGKEMKSKAKEWAKETPNIPALPRTVARANRREGMAKARSKKK